MGFVAGAFLLDLFINVILLVPKVVVAILYGWLAGLRRKAIVSGLTFRDLELEASGGTDYPYVIISFVVDSNTTANLKMRRFTLPIYRGSWSGDRIEVTPRWNNIPDMIPARNNIRISFPYRPPLSFWIQDADTVDIIGGEMEVGTNWGLVTCAVNLNTTQRISRFKEIRQAYLNKLRGWLELPIP